jgi:hypothetical protein
MEINVTTPAVLFPALSLLMLAYTNRFLALANLIRQLHATYTTEPTEKVARQIANLRYRVHLIKQMQALGILSTFLAVVCMFCLFEGWSNAAKWAFAASLFSLAASLALSFREVQLSGNALEVLLADMEEPAGREQESGVRDQG